MNRETAKRAWFTETTPRNKLVLLAVLSFAGGSMEGINPPVSILSEMTGLSTRSVRSALSFLRLCGVLVTTRSGSHESPTTYKIDPNRLGVKLIQAVENHSYKKKRRQSWLTPFAEAWQAAGVGEFPFARSSRPLSYLVKKHGKESVLSAWIFYVRMQEKKYLSVNRFSDRFGYWLDAAKKANPAEEYLDVESLEAGNAPL